ncbi:MAG: ABC transporter permease [Clostridiales bacterium]|nr:ABC transporter permease [Clostridiales bacterium]
MKTVNPQSAFGAPFFELTRRHLLVFFRNKIRVFFTLMVPFTIFLIYIFLLRDLEFSTVNGILSDIGASEGVALADDKKLNNLIGAVVDSWMLSGILAISTVTVSLQTNWMIISDKETGVNRDFASSPIKRNALIGSYFVFNVIVTVIICFIFFLVCLVYIAGKGEFLLTFTDFLTIFATIVFSSVLSVLLTVFICSFISRDGTMASVNTIFSTVIGFLIGAYMPFATMPEWVQNVCAFLPSTYSCSLLRYSFMSTPIDKLAEYVAESVNISNSAQLIKDLTDNFGYNLRLFGNTVTPAWQALAHSIFIVILVVANIFAGKNLITVTEGRSKKPKTGKNK